MNASHPRLSCIFIVLIAFITVDSQAQIYSYTSALSGTPAFTDVHTTASNLTRVNGAQLITACPDGFNTYKCTSATTFSLSRTAIEFSITPAANYQLNISSLSIGCRKNNKGPQKFRLAYSTNNGTTWQTNGTDYDLTVTSACGSLTTFNWDIPDFSTTGTLMVRLYCFKSISTTAGNLQMKDFVLSGSVTEVDNDTDGYVFSSDCNDADANIHPGASEICNTLDDDCNGMADEGISSTYYYDADADGYGDALTTVSSCSILPPGYSATSGDCDDADPYTSPSAAELCNSLDDNCDGNIDEGLPENMFFTDADGDSLGDYYTSINSCYASLTGYSLIPGDCDDLDPAINSYAEEVVNGYDDNCDGIIDTVIYFIVSDSKMMIREGQTEINATINIYPNPVADVLNVSISGFENTSTQTALCIYATDGTIVYSANYTLQTSDILLEIPVSKICPKGIYYLKLFSGGETWMQKFITL